MVNSGDVFSYKYIIYIRLQEISIAISFEQIKYKCIVHFLCLFPYFVYIEIHEGGPIPLIIDVRIGLQFFQ